LDNEGCPKKGWWFQRETLEADAAGFWKCTDWLKKITLTRGDALPALFFLLWKLW
jgi:hypothetical protein